jgi:hypothetical protein
MNHNRTYPFLAAFFQFLKWILLFFLFWAYAQSSSLGSQTLFSFFFFSSPQLLMILGLIWLGLKGPEVRSFRLPLSIALNLSFFCTLMVYLLENPGSNGQNPQAGILLFLTLLQDAFTLLCLLAMKRPSKAPTVTNPEQGEPQASADIPVEEV